MSDLKAVAAAAIAKALEQLGPGASREDKEKALRHAYPFGKRTGYAYMVWRILTARALGPRGRGKRILIDWACPRCGAVGPAEISARTRSEQLLEELRQAHSRISPDCPQQSLRWSYRGRFR